MEIITYWQATGSDNSLSFNLMQVKRKAALQLAREFAYSKYTKRLSSILHEVIEADEYSVSGYSAMDVGN